MNTLLNAQLTQSTHFEELLAQHTSALRVLVQHGVARATHLQRDVIVSFTLPVEQYDTIQAFAAAQQVGLGEVFFWEQPSQQNALVGVGTEHSIETTGTTGVKDAASQWRELVQESEVACIDEVREIEMVYGQEPLFFGGFAFDPGNTHTSLWAGFPDGLLLLPRFLLRYSKQYSSFTINFLLHAEDDSEQRLTLALNDAAVLLSTVKNTQNSEEEPQLSVLAIQDMLPADEWMHKVAEVAAQIRQGKFEKVVLARSVQITPQTTFTMRAILNRLRHAYPSTYIFALQRGQRFFVGATPERLVQAQNGQIHTMALAGSTPRGATLEEDERLGAALLQSEKNSVEHAIVVARVRESLLAHCSAVHVSDTPRLLKLKNVQHLETPIVGTLLAGRCILDVMADLHPTPAVGGFPREAALATIRRVEQLNRGWYAGPLGWIGAGGHGEFAVALRSGLVTENEAILFAGCGIVGDSNPQGEYAESCLKLQGMLRGLGAQD